MRIRATIQSHSSRRLACQGSPCWLEEGSKTRHFFLISLGTIGFVALQIGSLHLEAVTPRCEMMQIPHGILATPLNGEVWEVAWCLHPSHLSSPILLQPFLVLIRLFDSCSSLVPCPSVHSQLSTRHARNAGTSPVSLGRIAALLRSIYGFGVAQYLGNTLNPSFRRGFLDITTSLTAMSSSDACSHDGCLVLCSSSVHR